jgi:hypothetical protein
MTLNWHALKMSAAMSKTAETFMVFIFRSPE